MESISEQIRSRPDFKYGTKIYYKKHTWKVAFYQPEWRSESNAIKDAWYRNKQIESYLKNNEQEFKTRADRQFFVYLTRPDCIPWLIENYKEELISIHGPVSSKHQDILVNDLTIITRPHLWYKKFRYKVCSTRYGEQDQEIFEEMQNFCEDSFERGDYKLNDTFRITSKAHQYKMQQLWSRKNNNVNGQTIKRFQGYTGRNLWQSPYTATGSIYLVNHDDVVTLHMVYKKYITRTNKVVTLDEL
tara:strand:+ start:224 stop:958 length:735 start_codon:yes stop_codon:yes gene_type:complete